MAEQEPHLWLADPTTSWTVALTADLPRPPDPAAVTEALDRLNRRLAGATAPLVRGTDPEALLDPVTRPGPAPISAGVAGHRLAIAGQHQFVDGLALLAVLTELTGLPASSHVRGVEQRPSLPFRTELRQRLVELAVAPPARVTRSAPSAPDLPDAPGPGTSFARLRVEGHVSVAELVHACAGAVLEVNGPGAARRDRHRVAVAVGASERPGHSPVVGDHSALLRLRSIERASLDEVRRLLRTAPLTPSPGRALEGSGGLVTRLASWGVRLVGPRLGSTVTVSHLGRVEAEGADVAFFPVSGGSSGVSVGAVTQDGRTLLGARGRSREHSGSGLARLLDAIARRVGSHRG